MTEHKLFGTFTATARQAEGAIDLKEVECGSKYVLVEVGANYCPECGGEL